MKSIFIQPQWRFLWWQKKRGKIPQAIIFTGPEFLPKKETALEFIKLLNCQGERNTFQSKFQVFPDSYPPEQTRDFGYFPCQSCLSCQLIEKRKHPDLILVAPETGEIQISQIRVLQEKLNLCSQLALFKSAIIEKAEFLNPQAQNCLLKTLEEPKGKVILILLTSQPYVLFETIRSRCQILRFYPTSLLLPEKEELIKIEKFLKGDLYQKFVFVQKFFEQDNSSDAFQRFLKNFELLLRLILLKKLGAEIKGLEKFSFRIWEDYPLFKIKKAIEKVAELKILIKRTNINFKLAFENLILKLE